MLKLTDRTHGSTRRKAACCSRTSSLPSGCCGATISVPRSNSEVLHERKRWYDRLVATGRRDRLERPADSTAGVGGPRPLSLWPIPIQSAVAQRPFLQVEATTDLRNWISIFAGDSAGEIEYVDSQASKFGHRFYRLNVQGTLSANVVGYATLTLPPGFAMIANPLEARDSSVAELFKGVPEGTTVSKFDPQSSRLSENTFTHGKWTHPSEKLVPGEGAIIFNPTTDYKSLNFAGDVRQGSIIIPIPAGFSMRSSPLPQPGRLDSDLSFPITDGDVIHLFDRDRQKYVVHPFKAADWSSNPPLVGGGGVVLGCQGVVEELGQTFLGDTRLGGGGRSHEGRRGPRRCDPRRSVSQMDYGKQARLLVEFWTEAQHRDWNDLIVYLPGDAEASV